MKSALENYKIQENPKILDIFLEFHECKRKPKKMGLKVKD